MDPLSCNKIVSSVEKGREKRSGSLVGGTTISITRFSEYQQQCQSIINEVTQQLEYTLQNLQQKKEQWQSSASPIVPLLELAPPKTIIQPKRSLFQDQNSHEKIKMRQTMNEDQAYRSPISMASDSSGSLGPTWRTSEIKPPRAAYSSSPVDTYSRLHVTNQPPTTSRSHRHSLGSAASSGRFEYSMGSLDSDAEWERNDGLVFDLEHTMEWLISQMEDLKELNTQMQEESNVGTQTGWYTSAVASTRAQRSCSISSSGGRRDMSGVDENRKQRVLQVSAFSKRKSKTDSPRAIIPVKWTLWSLVKLAVLVIVCIGLLNFSKQSSSMQSLWDKLEVHTLMKRVNNTLSRVLSAIDTKFPNFIETNIFVPVVKPVVVDHELVHSTDLLTSTFSTTIPTTTSSPVHDRSDPVIDITNNNHAHCLTYCVHYHEYATEWREYVRSEEEWWKSISK